MSNQQCAILQVCPGASERIGLAGVGGSPRRQMRPMSNSFAQLYLLDPSPRARRLFWHLLSVGSAKLDAPDRHEGMDKPGAHLFWVQSGRGTLEIPGRSCALKPGACCWLVDMKKPRTYAPVPGTRL